MILVLVIGFFLVFIINIILLVLIVKEFISYIESRRKSRFRKEIEEVRNKERKQLIHFISSELHDNISQMLSLAKMNVKSLDSNTVNHKTKNNIISLLGKSLADIRYLNKMIMLQEKREIDVDRQIDELIEVLNQSSIINFKKNGQIVQLSKETNFLLFRIMQELLNNLMKYSKASEVKIEVNKQIISIFHNGISFIPSKEDYNKGFGLTSIEENRKLLHAEIEYYTKNPKIKLKLPLTSSLTKERSTV